MKHLSTVGVFLAGVIFATLLTSCGSNGASDSVNGSDYLPLAIGNRWSYRRVDPSSNTTTTETRAITGTDRWQSRDGLLSREVLEEQITHGDTCRSEREYFLPDVTGGIQYSNQVLVNVVKNPDGSEPTPPCSGVIPLFNRSLEYDPPLMLFPRILEKDKPVVQHAFEISTDQVKAATYEITYIGKQTVTIPAGTFECAHFIQSLTLFGPSQQVLSHKRTEVFAAAQIGPVRISEGNGQVLELTSAHIGTHDIGNGP